MDKLLKLVKLAERQDGKRLFARADQTDALLLRCAKADPVKLEGIREGIDAALRLMETVGDDPGALQDIRDYLGEVRDSLPSSAELSREITDIPGSQEDLDALMCFDV